MGLGGSTWLGQDNWRGCRWAALEWLVRGCGGVLREGGPNSKDIKVKSP